MNDKGVIKAQRYGHITRLWVAVLIAFGGYPLPGSENKMQPIHLLANSHSAGGGGQ